MTKRDISKSINKHSVKPAIAVILVVVASQILNGYFFEGAPVSPILIALLSVGACLYIFQKVLVELFVTESLSEKNESQ